MASLQFVPFLRSLFGPKSQNCLEDPLIHKKVLQTAFGIRAFFSAQIQFEHFLRLPRCLVKRPRENEPATRAQFPATRAQFSATRAQFQKVCKAKAPPRNLCLCMCLILPFLAHLFATKARANICVSMGPAGEGFCGVETCAPRPLHPRNFVDTRSEEQKVHDLWMEVAGLVCVGSIKIQRM